MQSNNPVFRRSEEFNRASTQTYSGYGDPSQWGTGQPGDLPYSDVRQGAPSGSMTIDTVVQKTATTLGIVIVVAFATWALTPDITASAEGLGALYGAMMVGLLGAFVLSMVNAFKRVVSPALVLAFAVFEGVAMGALSKFFDSFVGNGIVVQAVIGTFAAFGGTLAVYKFFNIQVGQKFRTMVLAAAVGMMALMLFQIVLSLFGGDLGIFGFGAIGLLFSVAGLVLGVLFLVLDFDFVEQGIRNGLPERESWRAAFAMTVSLVWIYTNLLRILAILNSD